MSVLKTHKLRIQELIILYLVIAQKPILVLNDLSFAKSSLMLEWERSRQEIS